MKKRVVTIVALFIVGLANAQTNDQTEKGNVLIETNTGFGSEVGKTSFGYISRDGSTEYNIGLEGGYFIMDNLALKIGLGFGGFSPKELASTSTFGYKIGAKYYVIGLLPVEISYNGYTQKNVSKNPSFVGFQAGYAIFLSRTISLEPGIRYNNSLDTEAAKSFVQLNMGFSLHF
jgi:hypothetical protein